MPNWIKNSFNIISASVLLPKVTSYVRFLFKYKLIALSSKILFKKNSSSESFFFSSLKEETSAPTVLTPEWTQKASSTMATVATATYIAKAIAQIGTTSEDISLSATRVCNLF